MGTSYSVLFFNNGNNPKNKNPNGFLYASFNGFAYSAGQALINELIKYAKTKNNVETIDFSDFETQLRNSGTIAYDELALMPYNTSDPNDTIEDQRKLELQIIYDNVGQYLYVITIENGRIKLNMPFLISDIDEENVLNTFFNGYIEDFDGEIVDIVFILSMYISENTIDEWMDAYDEILYAPGSFNYENHKEWLDEDIPKFIACNMDYTAIGNIIKARKQQAAQEIGCP